MAEDTDDTESASGAANADPAALHLAMTSSSDEAREYLRKQSELAAKQSRLADLQIDTLEKKDEFELSHLRFRRFSDYARFALEIAAGLVVLLIVAGLGTMVWNASRDRDLVVDAFSVPPDVAQTGMSGTALANRVLDRFGAMDHDVHSFTQDFSGYHRDAADEVRVEIPDTGVSIGELNRYLRGWLGAETHVTGELVRTSKDLALTVRYGSNPGTTVEGADLEVLIDKAAAEVFRAGDSLRYADYLSSHGHLAEGRAIAEAETHKGDEKHRAQAYVSLGTNDYWQGDSRALSHDGAAAVRLDPNNVLGWYMKWAYDNNMDHSEENLQISSKMLSLVKAGQVSSGLSEVARAMPVELAATVQSMQGDYAGAAATCEAFKERAFSACIGVSLAGLIAADYEIEKARTLLADAPRTRSNGKIDHERLFALVQIALPAGDYGGAIAVSKQAETLTANDPTFALDRDVFLRPYEAEALARTGHLAEAKALIATTPLECDTCVRTRGRIAMLARDWRDAAHWFAIVSARSPHIPFADTDWGDMLLAKGDTTGAIAKFASAHAKGPHFADPLVGWGEALMLQNRSDLALAKFEEASRYAPNWGRLHLKWGEALHYAGKEADAQKQLAVAAHLDLTPSEKAELAKMASYG